jgi:hypothetical protein
MNGEIPDYEEAEFREWVIEWIGADVSILGPGQLEIRLRRFDVRKIQRLEGSAEELGLELEEGEGLFHQTVFRVWGYPMGGATLRLCSISDAAKPAREAGHYLDLIHSEWTVEWHPVPEYFAEALHALGEDEEAPEAIAPV